MQPHIVSGMLIKVLHMAAPVQYWRLSSKYLKPTFPSMMHAKLSFVLVGGTECTVGTR